MKLPARFTVFLLLGYEASAGDVGHPSSQIRGEVAATPPEYPSCSTDCFLRMAANSTCAPDDNACYCADQAFSAAAGACIAVECLVQDRLRTTKLSLASCGVDPRDRSQPITIVTVVLTAIAILLVLLRMSYKLWAKMSLGTDDWLSFAAMLCLMPTTVFNTYYISHWGLGRDIWEVEPKYMYAFMRSFFVSALLYFTLMALTKLSLLFSFLRLFPARNMQRVLNGTIAFIILYWLAFFILTFLQCKPMSLYWTGWDGEHKGHCQLGAAIAYSNASINIATDIWMLGIPLYVIKGLQMSWNKKVAVGLMFVVGTLVTVMSILRLKSLVYLDQYTGNPTWDNWEISLWSTVETRVAVICICLPTFRLLLKRIFPIISDTTRRTKSYRLDHLSSPPDKLGTIERSYVNLESNDKLSPP